MSLVQTDEHYYYLIIVVIKQTPALKALSQQVSVQKEKHTSRIGFSLILYS